MIAFFYSENSDVNPINSREGSPLADFFKANWTRFSAFFYKNTQNFLFF